MAERTYLTQADEALRRAQANASELPRLLTGIATYLTQHHAWTDVDEQTLTWLASHHAWQHVDIATEGISDQPRVNALRGALLLSMPAPRRGETRGEYAIRLRAVARSL
ncbi:hypothetical protein ACF068_14625 [Streptomyces sp. NPDC016309]|uniref:hypothetical protein n=1 Tax=Streptomyces sp. NPDC016309 TaxID=3364965 RepID=UPI0036FA8A3F